MIHLATDKTFDEVVKDERAVLIKFGAQWCQPCKRLAPVLKELAEENIMTLKVVEIDAEDNPQVASHYDINRVPVLLLMVNGEVVHTVKGRTKEAIAVEVAEHI